VLKVILEELFETRVVVGSVVLESTVSFSPVLVLAFVLGDLSLWKEVRERIDRLPVRLPIWAE